MTQCANRSHRRAANALIVFIAADPFQLRGRNALASLRDVVERNPECEPQQTDDTGEDERPSPSEGEGDHRNGGWGDDGANIRSGVEDALPKPTLLFWQPHYHPFLVHRKFS